MKTYQYDLVITNGVCATAADIASYDIAIKDEKIVLLAPPGSLARADARNIIDAEGGYVTPGCVDCHVHLEEPAMFGNGSSSDTYETGTRSAVAGGCTTVSAFAPQQKKEPSLLKALRETHARALRNSYCDYRFHMLVGNPSEQALEELKAINTDEGLEAQNLFDPKYHSHSRPLVLESEATNRAIALSSLISHTPILLVHVSDPGATLRIWQAQTNGQPIFAETCPQYLFLTRDDLAAPGFEGAKCVCSPPPRDKPSQDAIWTRLRNGTFTTRLPLVFSSGRLSPTKFVEVVSTSPAPAKLYRLYPQKGSLIPGQMIWRIWRYSLFVDWVAHRVLNRGFGGGFVVLVPRFN
ncbi:hypothetical protein B0T25DRAFT_597300 [Lasiosphaeria hispida]|uniref:Amidohydrolase-related domain-containing protein n=1 Tax=Lasiosphaeria hispida TaxID=260671 RepID=A0AAJ0MKH7_9PEZI|nr:hypothetical protein B0T25DRAFT_597300 [Lasiosphaeria hispida]